MFNKFIQVCTTTSTKDEAEKIANVLVEKKLAACVQVFGPAKSFYRWKGKIEQTEEFICFIKSVKEKSEEIKREIKNIHNYEVPEIIITPIIDGSKEYLNWIIETVTLK